MNKAHVFITILLTLVIGWFFLAQAKTNIVNAQYCSSNITCCQIRETVLVPPGCSITCYPGDPNCVQCTYEDRCTSIGGTVGCFVSGSGCAQYAACPAGIYSGSCTYHPPIDPDPDPDPEPDPSSPPGWGACGSCNTCGFSQNLCVTTPEGNCVADFATCGTSGNVEACRIDTAEPLVLEIGKPTSMLIRWRMWSDNYIANALVINNFSAGSLTFAPTGQNECCTTGYLTPGDSNFTVTGNSAGYASFQAELRTTGRTPGDGNKICTKNFTVRITTPTPWAQILNGDLMTFGRISMTIPSGQFLVGREGSDEGIITHTTTNVPTAQVSQRGWNVSNSPLSRPLRYADLFEQVPLTPRQINGAINTSSLNPSPAQPDAFGYEWFLYSGNNAIIPNGLTISSGRKVVLFVPGDVTINGNISINDMSNSFFMLVSSGNITVSNPVGRNANETAPSLDGIYVSDGVFGTSRSVGANNNRVNVRGTVVALGGVNLQRDTQTAFPSETFSFAPELILNFPSSLSTKRAFWKEIAP